MSARLRCNLCKRLVLGGGHPCLGGANDGTGMREEHLAECAVCETFHEPHCPPKVSARNPSEAMRVLLAIAANEDPYSLGMTRSERAHV